MRKKVIRILNLRGRKKKKHKLARSSISGIIVCTFTSIKNDDAGTHIYAPLGAIPWIKIATVVQNVT